MKHINHNKLIILVILFCLTFLSFLLYNYGKNVNIDQYFLNSKNILNIQNHKKDVAQIQNLLDSSTAPLKGTWGVYIKDLKSGNEFTHQGDKSFGSASIYKLAVMYKTFDEIAKDQLKKDSSVSGDKKALDILIAGNDKEKIEKITDPEPISLEIEKALYEMITISDNYSALLLANKLGWKNINDFLIEQDLEDFNVLNETPLITPRVVGQLLEQIYSNSAVNPTYSKQMLDLLLNQKINDRIPKYLPDGVRVAHKTGELETIRHDVGIIYGKKSNYIFVFLTDSIDTKSTSENIALLSKKFYDALEKTN